MSKSQFLEMAGILRTLPVQKKKKDGTPLNMWDFRLAIPDEKYPQVIPFMLFQKGMDEFNANVGDTVTVTFTLGGKEWKDKCFAEPKAFKVEVITKMENKHSPIVDDGSDDLPFQQLPNITGELTWLTQNRQNILDYTG